MWHISSEMCRGVMGRLMMSTPFLLVMSFSSSGWITCSCGRCSDWQFNSWNWGLTRGLAIFILPWLAVQQPLKFVVSTVATCWRRLRNLTSSRCIFEELNIHRLRGKVHVTHDGASNKDVLDRALYFLVSFAFHRQLRRLILLMQRARLPGPVACKG